MASLPLLVCAILCTYYSLAHGGNEHGFVTVPTTASEPEAVCCTSRVTLDPGSNTVSMALVHRHGPCAPTTQSSDKPSFTERLRRSRARSKYIMSRASMGIVGTTRDDANVSIPTYLGGSVDSLEYVVTVSLGTPAVSQVVLIDTGSDLSWVQCKPCNSTACYPQKDPLFDPSKSATYAPVPCNSVACRNLSRDFYGGSCTSDGGAQQCGFTIMYGDGSQTKGVYSNETLTLAPGVAVKDFHFGCGHDQGSDNDNNKFDGLLGLGGAPESLVSQTSSVYGGAFSYCLPALNSQPGFLALGGPSGINTSGFVFTPMVREVNTFYVVNMTGITVGGKPIDVPASAFSGGMIIDSGTVATLLQHTAYNALQSAFREAMKAYPLVPNEDFDTCYNFTGYSNVTVPKVALTFSGGATIDLDVPNGILLDGCLAFQDSGPDQPVILGNVNQRTHEVLYDAGLGRVGFRAAAC